MVSNSAVKSKELALSVVSKTDSLKSFLCNYRLSSSQSVDLIIQQVVKFEIFSASFILLFSLSYTFKFQYKKELSFFLISDNLPGFSNFYQKIFKDTSKYVLPVENDLSLGKSKFYFNPNFINEDFTNFFENQGIKLQPSFRRIGSFKNTLESVLFNGHKITPNNNFDQNDKFIPSIYHQTKFFNKKKTTGKRTNFSSSSHLAFQSFATKNFVLSAIKRLELEKDGTSFQFSELPLNGDFSFGVFQKKDADISRRYRRSVRHMSRLKRRPTRTVISMFPSKRYRRFGSVANKVRRRKNRLLKYKSIVCLTKSKKADKEKIILLSKREKSIRSQLRRLLFWQHKERYNVWKRLNLEKKKKKWLCLDQNKSLQTQWFSIYEKKLSTKHLQDQITFEKLKKNPLFSDQPVLLDAVFSVEKEKQPFSLHKLFSFVDKKFQRYQKLKLKKKRKKKAKKKRKSSHKTIIIREKPKSLSLEAGLLLEKKANPPLLNKLISFVYKRLRKRFQLSKERKKAKLKKKRISSHKVSEEGKAQLKKKRISSHEDNKSKKKKAGKVLSFPVNTPKRTDWWHIFFRGNSNFNSNFIGENKKSKLNEGWKRTNYENYLQLDEFPSTLNSFTVMPSKKEDKLIKSIKPIKISEQVYKKRKKPRKKKKKINPYLKNQPIIVKKPITSTTSLPTKKFKDKFLLRESKSLLDSTFVKGDRIADKYFVTPQNVSHLEILNRLPKWMKDRITLWVEGDSFGLHAKYITQSPQSLRLDQSDLFPKSFRLRMVKNEIKGLLAFLIKDPHSIDKREKTFKLLSPKSLSKLDKILLNKGEQLTTLFAYLPQKRPNLKKLKRFRQSRYLRQTLSGEKRSLEKRPYLTKKLKKLKDPKKMTQLLHDFWSKRKQKRKRKKISRPKFELRLRAFEPKLLKLNQLLYYFWSKKEGISPPKPKLRVFEEAPSKMAIADLLTPPRPKNWFPFLIENLNTQPRYMSGYQFPDLDTKETNKLIKYSSSKKNFVNKTHLIGEIVNNFRKKKVPHLMWSLFSQISKKEIDQQRPIDVYLPFKNIERLPQSKYTSLQKNLFFDKKVNGKETIVWQEGAVALHHFTLDATPYNGSANHKLSQKLSQANHLIGGKAAFVLPPFLRTICVPHTSSTIAAGDRIVAGRKGIKLNKRKLKKHSQYKNVKAPVKFGSGYFCYDTAWDLDIFSQFGFMYHLRAAIKGPSMSNPRLQKMQIAKIKKKSSLPSIDFLKNLLSSTNFLTDRKQHFFALRHTDEIENREKSFMEKPFSGSFFGTDLDSNTINPQEKVFLPRNRKQHFFELLRSAQTEKKPRKRKKNFNLLKEDFSLSSLEDTLRDVDISAQILATAKSISINKGSKTFLPSKILKPRKILKPTKILKPITGINSYSFFDVSAFDPLEEENFQVKNDFFLNNCLLRYKDPKKNSLIFYSLPLPKKILEETKLKLKERLLTEGLDENEIYHTFEYPEPLYEEDWNYCTEWHSHRYKKPSTLYESAQDIFHLPIEEQHSLFYKESDRFEKNEYGWKEQKAERRQLLNFEDTWDEEDYPEELQLPNTVVRHLDFVVDDCPLPSKPATKSLPGQFCFFTKKPLRHKSKKRLRHKPKKLLRRKSRSLTSNLKNIIKKILNVKQKQKYKYKSKFKFKKTQKNVTQRPNDLFRKNLTKQNFISALPRFEKSGLSSAKLKSDPSSDKLKSGLSSAKLKMSQKKLRFVQQSVRQEEKKKKVALSKRRNRRRKKTSKLKMAHQMVPKKLSFVQKNVRHEEKKNKIAPSKNTSYQISPFSYFLSDRLPLQKNQSLFFYLKKLDTNCDRLDWQFDQWYPFLDQKYGYLPPSQSLINEEYRNSFRSDENDIKRYTLYNYSNSKHLQRSKTRNTFGKTYGFSLLQTKKPLGTGTSNIIFDRMINIIDDDPCWEPITIRSWMMITQYFCIPFLIQSGFYVYDTHSKKVMFALAEVISANGTRLPAEQLQHLLGDVISKNVQIYEKVSKRFQDIVAIDRKLPQLGNIVWFLKNAGRTNKVSQTKGVLFVGPPGTGKTLLVQAIAGEAQVPVLVLSGNSFKDQNTAQFLSVVFQRARTLAPSILFIDEIDTIGESRSNFAHDGEGSKLLESIEKKNQGETPKTQSVKQVGLLTTFLIEMDGLAKPRKRRALITFGKPGAGGILVIGTTNRPQVLDPALTRPGRFDQIFYLSNPGKEKRIEILKIYTKNIGVSPSLPWDYLGDRTLGFSGADLSAIANKSTIQAILSHTTHTVQSLEDGIESLPTLSQNALTQNQNNGLKEILFLKPPHNENTILCQSIFTSLSICTKDLNLQNKYQNFYFSNHQSKSSPNFDRNNLVSERTNLGRWPFYQAGKIIVQRLLSQDTLAATLSPKQELSFIDLFKESIHVKEVTNRYQLETRLISGYAGKAAETLFVSGLQFSKKNQTWQSTLGVEEWKLTNSLAYLMIFKYHFYLQGVTMQKENFIALSRNKNETANFQVLQNIFFKQESNFTKERNPLGFSESELEELAKKEALKAFFGKKNYPLNPITWISQLYEKYEIVEILGRRRQHTWYRFYMPSHKTTKVAEKVRTDQYYFGRENLIELIWNTSKNKSINWSDISQLDSDFIYHGLVVYNFNKALSLLDKNREILDLFANLLISFRIIRKHEIQKIFSYLKYSNPHF